MNASWGAPVDFTAAKVKGNKSLHPGMHSIMVDVGSSIAATYAKPGQFLQVRRQLGVKAFAHAWPPHVASRPCNISRATVTTAPTI